jgi:hypothetical protein
MRLTEISNNFYLSGNSGGPSLLLKYAGAAAVDGTFGSYAPIGVEQTATGYEVVWKSTGADRYTVWSVDGSGNYIGSTAAVSGSSATILSHEISMYQDLNGDGLIGNAATVIAATGNVQVTLQKMTQAATIAAGATLELTGADSGSITFNGSTGKLILDHSMSFTGKIFNLTGDGNPSNSDQIDLRDIAYGPNTTYTYVGNTAGGTLTVSDGQNHTAHLSLVGNYTNSTFTLSSDGNGGTLVIDPPKEQFNLDIKPPAANAVAPPMVAITKDNTFEFGHAVSENLSSPPSPYEAGSGINGDHALALAEVLSGPNWNGAGHQAAFVHSETYTAAYLHDHGFLIS